MKIRVSARIRKKKKRKSKRRRMRKQSVKRAKIKLSKFDDSISGMGRTNKDQLFRLRKGRIIFKGLRERKGG